MALYFLTYDLRKSRNYQPLYNKLSDFDAVRILESTWCFRRVHTDSEGLCGVFRGLVDSDDGLIVSEVVDWASWNADGTPNDLS